MKPLVRLPLHFPRTRWVVTSSY